MDPDMCTGSKVRSLFFLQGGKEERGGAPQHRTLRPPLGAGRQLTTDQEAFAWSSGRVFIVSLFLCISAHF